MVRLFGILFLLALCLPLHAENAGPNSAIPDWSALEIQLYQQPKAVADILQKIDPESFDSSNKAAFYNLQADVYLVLSDYEASEYAQLRGMAHRSGAEPYVMAGLQTKGAYFTELAGELDAAESAYLAALRVAEQNGHPDAIVLSYTYLISFYSNTREEYELALEYVQLATAELDRVQRSFLVADVHAYYGNLLSYLDDRNGASAQFMIAQNIYQQQDNNVSQSDLLYNQAMMYDANEDYISALRTYEAFITKANKWGDPTAEFFGYMGIANSYSYLERFEQAFDAINKSLASIEYIADPVYLYDFWSSLVYIAADVNDFVLAEQAWQEVEALAAQLGVEEQSWMQVSQLNMQKYLAKKKGDFEQAFALSEDIRHLQYDLLLQDQEEVLTQMRLESESAVLQAETDRLALQNRQQQQQLLRNKQQITLLSIGVIVLAGILLVLLVRLRLRSRRSRRKWALLASGAEPSTNSMSNSETAVAELFTLATESNSALSVVLFECHSMLKIRNSHGEQAVDDVCKWIKASIRRESRTHDQVAQLSPSRFMWILPDANVAIARRRAAHMLALFQTAQVPGYPEIELSVSGGATERQEADMNSQSLTYRAAMAVNKAHEKGDFQIEVIAV